VLLLCACAVVSGARTVTEITEWGVRATTTAVELLGIRRHLPGRRRAPSHATLTRLLAALDGGALDTAICAYLAERDHPTPVHRDRRPRRRVGAVVTFDTLHSVKDQVRWLVREKKTHYIAVIKGN
jgi:hypothetical protein